MLEDLNFLHSSLDNQVCTKPSIHLVLADYHTSGTVKDYLEKAFPVEVLNFKDATHYWQEFKAPEGLFLVIIDGNFAGIELIAKLKQKNLAFKTILITDMPRPGDHLELSRPISYDRLKVLVENIFGTSVKRPEQQSFGGLIGDSTLMQEVFSKIKNAGPRPILISGPAGSGKSSVAEAINKNISGHTINCGHLSPGLLENEMFGPDDGKLGQGGVVYFKDIDKLPLLSQAKLIKHLKNQSVDAVKIVASTRKDLIDFSNAGDFRKDLLNLFGAKIILPSLEDREGDLELLITHFNEKYSAIHGCEGIRIDESALSLLREYEWPENVRELENLIEKLVILHTGSLIETHHLLDKFFKGQILESTPYQLPETGIDLRQLLRDIEDSLIKQALDKTGGNKNRASKLLQINRTTLVEKLKKRKRELNNQVP
ncbi:MAG: hypothetical protein DRQ88_07645 [Epsilonproteobacteria bacterium]|nr:MAG: hypothetical protein DRQ89_09440 [Campylobacterota bacterium]RLA66128.1 MAG: hypothetical protein DRQ88_07645 [Campylobacterota bacterium]